MNLVWHSINLPPNEIYLDKLLRCGQAFRWVKNNNIWSSTLNNRVVFLRQTEDQLEYASLTSSQKNSSNIKKLQPKLEEDTQDDVLGLISNYLNLQISIVQLYKDWASKDAHFAKVSAAFAGIRMLQQDPWETLISFICSSNNNVKRISKMCHALCLEYGDFIVEYAGTKYYSFPTPVQLASRASEASLRELGFGYRARYVYETAQMLADDKALFMQLHSMRSSSFTDEQVHEFLLQFKGVGPKVADCVALMSLNRHSLVPIDTHVLQFARRDYSYKFRGRSNATLSSAMYVDMKRFFVDKWGSYAGWAHSVLFTRDLKLE